MDLNDFFYYSFLQGYKIMGVDKTKIERIAQIKEFERLYQEFVDTIDTSTIEDYFKLALNAKVFRAKNGHLLKGNDNLFWRFNSKGYQYLLCRRPIKTSGNYIGNIMNELFQRSGIK